MVKKSISKVTKTYARLSPYSFANAAGILSALAIVVVYLLSATSSYNGQIVVDQYPLSGSLGIEATNFLMIITLIESYVLSYMAGWIFVYFYNRTQKV